MNSDHIFLSHLCRCELAPLNSTQCGGLGGVEIGPGCFRLRGLPLHLTRTAAVPRNRIERWVFVTSAVPPCHYRCCQRPGGGLWADTWVSPGTPPVQGPCWAPGSCRGSSACGRIHGAWGEAQPRAAATGQPWEGPPEDRPSACTHILGCTRKLTANAAGSEQKLKEKLSTDW